MSKCDSPITQYVDHPDIDRFLTLFFFNFSAVALFTSGSYLGTVVTLISAPPLIVRYDWPSAFYVFGCLGFVFIVLWQWLVADTPTEHGGVHPKEVCCMLQYQMELTFSHL